MSASRSDGLNRAPHLRARMPAVPLEAKARGCQHIPKQKCRLTNWLPHEASHTGERSYVWLAKAAFTALAEICAEQTVPHSGTERSDRTGHGCLWRSRPKEGRGPRSVHGAVGSQWTEASTRNLPCGAPGRRRTDRRSRRRPVAPRGRKREGRSASGTRWMVRSPHWEVSHGFKSGTPVGAKSATFRVTTVIPCARAVAAMNASRSGRGSGT
jgi:hypothetical protein